MSYLDKYLHPLLFEGRAMLQFVSRPYQKSHGHIACFRAQKTTQGVCSVRRFFTGRWGVSEYFINHFPEEYP